MGFIVGVFTGLGFGLMLTGNVPAGLIIIAVATLLTVLAICN